MGQLLTVTMSWFSSVLNAVKERVTGPDVDIIADMDSLFP